MLKSVIRVVDSKDSITLSVRSFTNIDFSLSSLHGLLLARYSRNRETCGNLLKSWVIPLYGDFLVSTLTHPSKDLHFATLFGAPVNVVGDKFGSALVGLGFRRRGAPEHRSDNKRQGRTYHVCIGVIRVVDAKYSPTFYLELHAHRLLSLSFSLEFTCTTGPKLLERRNGRESCEDLGHTTVLEIGRAHV